MRKSPSAAAAALAWASLGLASPGAFATDHNLEFRLVVMPVEVRSMDVANIEGTQRAGQPMHGEYAVVSGTGMYAGAKGGGSFDAVPHKLAGANVFNGKLAFSTP